jgi:hypothetical protein
MTKPVVKYRRNLFHHIRVGEPALVYPIDHPDNERVSNTGIVQTSLVLSYESALGRFETENTKYIPEK